MTTAVIKQQWGWLICVQCMDRCEATLLTVPRQQRLRSPSLPGSHSSDKEGVGEWTMEIKEIFNLARVPSILVLGVVYVAYVLIGGVVFWKLEGELSHTDIRLLLLNRNRLLRTYTCLNQEGLEEVAQVRRSTEVQRENPNTFSKMF